MKKKIFVFFLIAFSFSSFSQKKIIIDVKIKGAKKTKISEIQKVIETKKNTLLDSTLLNSDIIRLKRLPAISHAYFKVFHSHENKYNVFINIEENFTLIPEFNVWTTTENRTAYKVGLYDYNFLGRNITFGGFYQYNGFNSYGINFRSPTLFSRKWGVSATHQNWKSEEPLYFDDKSANYLYSNISFETLALYQINFKNNLEFGVNYFKEKYEYLKGHTEPNVPQLLNVNKWLFKTVYTYDNLDYNYQYISGFKNQFYGQYVVSEKKHQDDFLIFWNDFFYYKRIGNKGNWANRLRFGLSSNNNTPFAPFALDNNLNLRGIGILVDRGTGSIVWNSEYRYTLFENKWFTLQSNTFTDIGTWRKPGGKLNNFFNREFIKIYSGFGLRLINKKIFNAIIRVDYAFKIHNDLNDSFGGLVFGIGQYF